MSPDAGGQFGGGDGPWRGCQNPDTGGQFGGGGESVGGQEWHEIQTSFEGRGKRYKEGQEEIKKTSRSSDWEREWANDDYLRSIFHTPISNEDVLGISSHIVEKFGTHPLRIKFENTARAPHGAEAEFFVDKIRIGTEGMRTNIVLHEIGHFVNRELAFDRFPTALNRIPDHGAWFNKSMRLVADSYLEYKGINLTMNEWAKSRGKKKSAYSFGLVALTGLWSKYNPHHDPRTGRFTSAPGGRAGSASAGAAGSALADDDLASTPLHGSDAASADEISPSIHRTSTPDEGGVNAVHFVEYRDENGELQKGVFKPIRGENPQVHPAFRGRQCINEVAASIVDEEMGLDMAAPAKFVKLDGRHGSLAKYINDNAVVAKNLTDDQIRSVGRINDMMYYDALIGNTDRHLGNWVVKDGVAKLIDNGMSFGKNSHYEDSRLKFRGLEHDRRFAAFHPMSPWFREGLGRLLSRRSQVSERLRRAGLDDERIDSFFKRADYLQRAGVLGFGLSTLQDLGRLAEGRQMF